MKKELPFETLMDYADGCLDAASTATAEALLREDQDAQELVDGLRAIYKNENLNSSDLQQEFKMMENKAERKIYLHSNFSNHLIELNRQLRTAAAVFLLIFSSSLLMSFSSINTGQQGVNIQHGPYDLALGSKIAP